jgi:hypothetical protein
VLKSLEQRLRQRVDKGDLIASAIALLVASVAAFGLREGQADTISRGIAELNRQIT